MMSLVYSRPGSSTQVSSDVPTESFEQWAMKLKEERDVSAGLRAENIGLRAEVLLLEGKNRYLEDNCSSVLSGTSGRCFHNPVVVDDD